MVNLLCDQNRDLKGRVLLCNKSYFRLWTEDLFSFFFSKKKMPLNTQFSWLKDFCQYLRELYSGSFSFLVEISINVL